MNFLRINFKDMYENKYDEESAEFFMRMGEITVLYERSVAYTRFVINNLVGSFAGADIWHDKKLSSENIISEYKKQLKHISAEHIEFKEPLHKLLIEMDRCRQQRNDVVHSIWRSMAQDGQSWSGFGIRKDGMPVLVDQNNVADLQIKLRTLEDNVTKMLVDVLDHRRRLGQLYRKSQKL